MTNKIAKNNITQLNEHLDHLFDYTEGLIELRPCKDLGSGIDSAARRWLELEEFKQKVPSIIDYCRRNYLACCIGLLPRTAAGGTAEYVESGCVVWADCDDKDFKGGRAEIYKKIESLYPEPSAVVRSGGGLHVYYYLGEDTPADEIEEANRRLAALIGGDNVHDRARVLRLPLSYHCKDPQKIYRLQFVSQNHTEHSILDLLDEWPEVATSRPVEIAKIQHIATAGLSAQIKALMSRFIGIRDLWAGIGKATGDQTGSGYDYAVARELIWYGADPVEVADAIAYRVQERGKSKPDKYYARTVGRAVADVARFKRAQAESAAVLDGQTPESEAHQQTTEQLVCYPEEHRRAGELIKNLHNVVTILSTDPRWTGKIRYNSFKQRIEIDSSSITDTTSTAMRLWLYRAYGLQVAKDMMVDAIEHVAQQNQYHPVQQYLLDQKWDGVQRLNTWLSRLMGADNTPLNAEIGTRWLVQGVARILTAGAQTDGCLILQGAQGIGKSSALRILARRAEWYRDSFIDIRTGRDAYSKLAGVWIYEFPELESTRGRDNNSVKAFLTQHTDTYRPAYARYEQEVPRQVIFAGTTNDIEILNDPTGSRRYWIVKCGVCHFDKLRAEADQLWAEAVHIYNTWSDPTRWAWLLDPAVSDDMAEVHAEHQQVDTWAEYITSWANNTEDLQHGATVADILETALGITADRQSRSTSTRLGTLLSGMGWLKRRRSIDGARVWLWYPPHVK
jgi:putative DNA primase/helicase